MKAIKALICAAGIILVGCGNPSTIEVAKHYGFSENNVVKVTVATNVSDATQTIRVLPTDTLPEFWRCIGTASPPRTALVEPKFKLTLIKSEAETEVRCEIFVDSSDEAFLIGNPKDPHMFYCKGLYAFAVKHYR